jgi:hypothetical protein
VDENNEEQETKSRKVMRCSARHGFLSEGEAAMPFSEGVKYLAKAKAAFRCCVCHKPFVEVHHLVAESEGGPDSLENAAPLCASCHDLYGGNPQKRKTLTQMRDHWWELMAERVGRLTDVSDNAPPFEISEDRNHQGGLHNKGVGIYHVVFPDEGFETAASVLFKLVCSAQDAHPNRRRHLYLDIDGHRNKKGGFDDDMFELQTYFIVGFLMQYLCEASTPLGRYRNTRWQKNDMPSELRFLKQDFSREDFVREIDRGSEGMWLAEKGMWLRFPVASSAPDRPQRRSKRDRAK